MEDYERDRVIARSIINHPGVCVQLNQKTGHYNIRVTDPLLIGAIAEEIDAMFNRMSLSNGIQWTDLHE
jgi:hypothetical protein